MISHLRPTQVTWRCLLTSHETNQELFPAVLLLAATVITLFARVIDYD